MERDSSINSILADALINRLLQTVHLDTLAP